jgi:hypothetical protein
LAGESGFRSATRLSGWSGGGSSFWLSTYFSWLINEPLTVMSVNTGLGKGESWLAPGTGRRTIVSTALGDDSECSAELTFRNNRLCLECGTVGAFIGLALPAIKRNEMIDTIK